MWKAIEDAFQHKLDPFDYRGSPWNIFSFESSPFMRDNCARTLNLSQRPKKTEWSLQDVIQEDPDGIPKISDLKNAFIQLSQVIRENSCPVNMRTCTIQIDEFFISLEEYLASLPFATILYIQLLLRDDPLTFVQPRNDIIKLSSKTVMDVRREDEFFCKCLFGTQAHKFPLFLSRWPECKPHPDWIPTWQRLRDYRKQLFLTVRGRLIRCINKPSSKHFKKYSNSLINSKASLNSALIGMLDKMVHDHMNQHPIQVSIEQIQLPIPHSGNWDLLRALMALVKTTINKRIIIVHNEPVWRREHRMSKYYNHMRSFLMDLSQPKLAVLKLPSLKDLNHTFEDYLILRSDVPNVTYIPNSKDWKKVVRSLPTTRSGQRTTHFVFESVI